MMNEVASVSFSGKVLNQAGGGALASSLVRARPSASVPQFPYLSGWVD